MHLHLFYSLMCKKNNKIQFLIFPLLRCIFIPDNGAFFVNYVITTAFIGNAVQLVRLPQLLLYAIKLACARSAAERTTVRKVRLQTRFQKCQNIIAIYMYLHILRMIWGVFTGLCAVGGPERWNFYFDVRLCFSLCLCEVVKVNWPVEVWRPWGPQLER